MFVPPEKSQLINIENPKFIEILLTKNLNFIPFFHVSPHNWNTTKSNQTQLFISIFLQHRRYKILCINLIKDTPKPEVASQIILTHLQMPEENYRMGKTKVYLLF